MYRVNTSERVAAMLRDVKQLAEAGYESLLPPKILESIEMTKKFYRPTLALKQVSNFYNCLGSQIIDAQRKMLQEHVAAFETAAGTYSLRRNLVVSKDAEQGDTVVWNDPAELEDYIQRLQAAAQSLVGENKKLRKMHLKVLNHVLSLFEADLPTHQ